jgi:hypothetical protein
VVAIIIIVIKRIAKSNGGRGGGDVREQVSFHECQRPFALL